MQSKLYNGGIMRLRADHAALSQAITIHKKTVRMVSDYEHRLLNIVRLSGRPEMPLTTQNHLVSMHTSTNNKG